MGFSFPVPSTVSSKLDKLGLHRDEDLALHLPLRWEDETRLTPIRDLVPGLPAVVQATVQSAEILYRPKRQLVATVADDSGQLVVRLLNFYPAQARTLQPGKLMRFSGEARGGFFGLEMIHPRFQAVTADTPMPANLTPVYPTTAGLGQVMLRKLIVRALSQIDLSETLPESAYEGMEFPGFAESIQLLHQPEPGIRLADLESHCHPAFRRLAYDELLAQQFSLRLARKARADKHATPMKSGVHLEKALRASLPFRLTPAQERAWSEISRDLGSAQPMRRLLQGDVGSGKTIVAALACLQAVENGMQATIMAPTEILAEQHYRKLKGWMEPLGVEIAWLASALSIAKKRDAIARIESGQANLAVGTHALFQKGVHFRNLGLAIVDEQHRFGVRQRLELSKKGLEPHQLMMSATPIPRTLAMSYYADLDVSVIDSLPPGRKPVTTKLVANSRREEILQRVRNVCASGGQSYWVCPLIEESEKLQLQTALDTFHTLRKQLPGIEIGLVHGRMKTADKNAVMDAFVSNQVQLLVSTTVIEVGVDVPNASLMVIEHAERFGLSQLHQLRGRIGRGNHESVCILLYQNPLSEDARSRLKIIYESADGFEIARKDLLLRGPGELLGSRQSGVPLLRFANPERDIDLLELARMHAPKLIQQQPDAVSAHLARWFGTRMMLASG
ncbi:MAG: ATP-dependent DNA helicase RecG [Hydrogenophilaceae bacterium]|nr:ATP-dependent DNA helicase RecG [Hydrogenophilaceae bacterium]